MRVAVLALVLVSGCSFVLTRNPPPPPAAPQCTSSSIAPIADTAVAVLAVIGVVYFATSDRDDATLGAVIEGGLALGFGASAYTGFSRVGRCKDAKALRAAR